MFNNFFYLNRCIAELNEVIKGGYLQEAYSQEKDKFYIKAINEDYPHRHLVISSDQNLPYILVKSEHHKAKKNTVDFFADLLPGRIDSIQIAEGDRVIRINLTEAAIYYLIRGVKSNIVAITEDEETRFFKKNQFQNEDELLSLLKSYHYTDQLYYPDFSQFIQSNLPWKEVQKRFPFITKEIVKEAKARISSEYNETADFDTLIQIIQEIYQDDISVSIDETNNRINFHPVNFLSTKNNKLIASFSSFGEAMNKYLAVKFTRERELKLRKEIKSYLDRELSKASNKLNNLKARIDKGSKEEEYYHYGNLLLMNKNHIHKGMGNVELTDYLTNESIKIPLKSDKTPQENIDNYFDKARAEKISFQKSKELYEEAKQNYERLRDYQEQLAQTETIDGLKKIKDELNLKTKGKMKEQESGFNFKHYLIDNEFHVYVGRDSRNNDELTLKYAKQNDYWFHARGVSGSHAVIRVDNPKKPVPKSVIKSAAAIAAFHSKAKSAGMVPVSYTFRKYVHKSKGMAPGAVKLSREDTVIVRPEIPKNAEYIED
jgi:predicted ribosome quality control (RQC) complex YloA/Tae2 family protein